MSSILSEGLNWSSFLDTFHFSWFFFVGKFWIYPGLYEHQAVQIIDFIASLTSGFLWLMQLCFLHLNSSLSSDHLSLVELPLVCFMHMSFRNQSEKSLDKILGFALCFFLFGNSPTLSISHGFPYQRDGGFSTDASTTLPLCTLSGLHWDQG